MSYSVYSIYIPFIPNSYPVVVGVVPIQISLLRQSHRYHIAIQSILTYNYHMSILYNGTLQKLDAELQKPLAP